MFINSYIGNNKNMEVVYEKKDNNFRGGASFTNTFSSIGKNVSGD